MTTYPSGISVHSPKIRNSSIVRRFVSQGGRGYVALDIQSPDGTSVDPDDDTLTLNVWFNDVSDDPPPSDPRGTLVLELTADDVNHPDTGKFDYEIGPDYTAQRGVLTVEWAYEVDGKAFSYTDNLQILNRMPLYDSLTEAEKMIVEQVTWMMGDLFDSTEGGAYLIEPFQTHFDYERIAQLANIATVRINTTGFPVTYWGFGPDGGAIPQSFAGITVLATYYELVRHLVRSYVEIPARVNMQVTYLDRRDYMQRWQSILQSEWPEFQRQIKMAKRDLLNLGKGSLLVAGGLYGGSANGIFQAGIYAAQARGFRFYPAAPAVMFGGNT